MVNSNIPYVQTTIQTGKNDTIIYPVHQGDSLRIRLEGNCKLVAKGADDIRDQTIFESGWTASDYLVNKYTAFHDSASHKCVLDNSHTSQLYSIDSYVEDGLINTIGAERIESNMPVEDMTLNLTALQDMFLVIFNRGRRFTNISQVSQYACTWFVNYTIEQVKMLVEGVYQYVVPRATLFIGQYLISLLSGYLFPNLIEYVNNASSGQVEYQNAIDNQQPIIEEVEDAIVPI